MSGLLPRAGFQARIERVLAELWPEAPEAAKPLLCRWLELLEEWNRRLDLTAARSSDELVDLCVADAAILGRAASGSWVDVGSGAGAPGLPVALLAPQTHVTLLEPRSKRVAFLRTVVGTLGVSNLSVVRGRSSEIPAQAHEVGVARATFAPSEWLQEGARIASTVWVLLAKDAAPELAGWEIAEDERYRWPLTGVERRAVRYRPLVRSN